MVGQEIFFENFFEAGEIFFEAKGMGKFWGVIKREEDSIGGNGLGHFIFGNFRGGGIF